MKISLDKKIGKIKELHGVNCAPYTANGGKKQSKILNVFGFLKTPRSRLHDCCGAYGGKYFVDIPNIFQNFDADENDPNNYDFYYTDEYISAIINSGAQIVYRLGVTIEWGSKKYTTNPPKDFDKWARICEHIIMHYNDGWANGFHYNIEYWEVWNEPENPESMWTGSKEQFFDLYKKTSIHLKNRFPNIKIGGYGSCGFYAVFDKLATDFQKSFVTWFIDFLSFVKENNCPLDFYSWHIYTSKVEELLISAKFVREKLDEYGFTKTENHLNEWNYGAEGGGFDNMDTMVGAGFLSQALIRMQNESSVDLAQYYCLSASATYNGMLYQRTNKFTPVIYVFKAFADIFALGNHIQIHKDIDEPYALGATDGKISRVLISNYQNIGKSLHIDDIKDKKVKIFKLLGDEGFSLVNEIASEDCEFFCDANAVYYLEIV